jgi:hypothetical protein
MIDELNFAPEFFGPYDREIVLPPGVCTECGGAGQLMGGDGGGPNGEATEFGYTCGCYRCGGSGYAFVFGGEVGNAETR